LASRLLSERLTARRAAWIIGAFTLLVTLLATVLIWIVDRDDFPSLGVAAWWAMQTVTTVGYGDYVPQSTGGRIIGAFVMVGGIGFLTVITASIAAAFVENARRRLGADADSAAIAEKLDEALARLERVERALERSNPGSSDPTEGPGGPRGH
jgi:voltage-gated potassium channel